MSDDTVSPLGVKSYRPIKSFVRRAGRMGTGQRRALDALAPTYVVPYVTQLVDWGHHFGRAAPMVLEIGFGMGGATAAIAAARPGTNFIAIEVHEAGVGALLKLIDEGSLENLRIVQHDAVEVLLHMVPPGSLEGVHIYFPDPWHKKRHHKRRLIQPAFISQLVPFLTPSGYLHCATDWKPYAQQILEVLSAEPQLQNTAENYAPRPHWRPTTKFEERGKRLGHGVWDLLFRRK